MARLQRDGDTGLTDGILLLAAMLEQAGSHSHPQRSAARLAALDWLNSEKVLDTFSRWPDVTREETARTAAALCLLETSLKQLPEAERPSFAGLLRTLEIRLAGSGGLDTPVAASGQDHAGVTPTAKRHRARLCRKPLSSNRRWSWYASCACFPAGWLSSRRAGLPPTE